MSTDGAAYHGLKQHLRVRIEEGDLREGQQLPPEVELVGRFNLTRHQVRRALRELELEGYIERAQGRGTFVTPRSARPRGLRVAASSAVAVSFPHYASLYSRQTVEGFMQRMSNAGRSVVAYSMQYDDNSEYEFLQSVRDSGVVGVAIWLGHINDRTRRLMRGLQRERFPVVLMDRYLPEFELDSVTSDNEGIGYALTRALIERGHRRLCFIMPDEREITSAVERLAGFRRALAEASLQPLEGGAPLVVGFEGAEFEGPLHALMARRARPTAFCCVNDLMARLLCDGLARLDHEPGRDIELAAVDDTHVMQDAGIPMLRVAQRGYDIGTRSADLLLARIAEPDRPVQRLYLEPGPLQVPPSAASKGGDTTRNVPTDLSAPSPAK